MGTPIKKRPKEIFYEKLLDGAIVAVVYSIEVVRFAFKVKRRLTRTR